MKRLCTGLALALAFACDRAQIAADPPGPGAPPLPPPAPPPPAPPLAEPPPPRLARLAAGTAHACHIDGRGDLRCWGDNRWGQLGDGTTGQRPHPARVDGGLAPWTAVSAGGACAGGEGQENLCGAHTCAIAGDGSLWCWGRNFAGQLGDGTTQDRHRPVRVGSERDWLAVRAGPTATCGLRAPGTLWCWGGIYTWGYDFIASAGPGRPERVTELDDFVQVDLGGERRSSFSAGGCAVRATGEIWCWSETARAPFPQPDDWRPVRKPAPLAQPGPWTAVHLGGTDRCALHRDGSIWCTDHTRRSDDHALHSFAAGPGWHHLGAGDDHACAVRDGQAFCWGSDQFGQRGAGERATTRERTLVAAPGGARWQAVATGDGFTCGVTADDRVWCWGRNHAGELGLGVAGHKAQPVRVGEERWRWVGVAARVTTAVRDDGSLWFWGASTNPGWGPWWGSDRPRAAGDSGAWSSFEMGALHPCGIRRDGALWCWADAINGPPAARQRGRGTDWEKVSVSGSEGCAIRREGALHCFGEATPGGPGAAPADGEPALVDAGPWADVSVTDGTRCAVRRDGTLWCWGLLGGRGYQAFKAAAPLRLGDGADWRTVAVAAPTSCGVRGDGALWCWATYAREPTAPAALTRPMALVGGAARWTSLDNTGWRLCAIDADGALSCWQLRLTAAGVEAVVEPPVAAGRRWSHVSADNHVCALDQEGGLWCWGDNSSGQIGDGSAWRAAPALVSGGAP